MQATLRINSSSVVFDDVEDAQRAFEAILKGTVVQIEWAEGEVRRFSSERGLSLETGANKVYPPEAYKAYQENKFDEYLEEERKAEERSAAFRKDLGASIKEIMDRIAGRRSESVPEEENGEQPDEASEEREPVCTLPSLMEIISNADAADASEKPEGELCEGRR